MENDEVFLECPDCRELIAYDQVQEGDHNPDVSKCPECGVTSPTEDWFY